MLSKTEQLQVRVSPSQKRMLKVLAAKEGISVSEYILRRSLPDVIEKFNDLIVEASNSQQYSYALAEISDYLNNASAKTLLSLPDIEEKSSNIFIKAYIASMLHYTCRKRGITPPSWISKVSSLTNPYFGSELLSLRPYLLMVSPPEFKAKNIFIDASVGDRV